MPLRYYIRRQRNPNANPPQPNPSAKVPFPCKKTPILLSVGFLLFVGLSLFLSAFILNGRKEVRFNRTTVSVTSSSTGNIERSPVVSWNDSKLLYMSNFRWTRNNVSLCDKGSKVDAHLQEKLLLILVNTARENYPQRSAIRASLKHMTAKVSAVSEWTTRLVFLIGEAYDPDNSAEKDVLQLEDALLADEEYIFKDLVGGNFIDTFDNLTLKTMMGIKWALTFCPEAKFVVKMDDDAFFNVPKFVQWRNTEMYQTDDKTTASDPLPQLYCIPEKDKVPLRKPSNLTFDRMRWLVSKSEWPGETFPDYCSGVLYGMTPGLMEKIYQVSPSVDYFRMEDIFVTGSVLDKIKAQYGPVTQRFLGTDQMSEASIKSMCDNKIMRQTISKDIGLAVELKRDHPNEFEKQMMCLAKEVSFGNN